MYFKNQITNLLLSKSIEPEQIDSNLFQIISNNNFEAFCELGLVGKKQLESLWLSIQSIKLKYSMTIVPLKTEKDIKKTFSKIYSRFPIVQNNIQGGGQVNSLIYGPCGHGKTSTINNICGTNHLATQGKRSITDEITVNQSRIKYNPKFMIIDTPGTTSNADKLINAAYLRRSLTWKPLNTVFVLVKAEPRYEQFFLQLLFQAQILKGYHDKVVFLVSHLDCCKEPELLIKDVNDMFNQRKIHSQVLYFSNKYLDKEQFCYKLYQIAKSIPQSKIQISQEHFLKYFNLKRNEKQQLFFNEKEKELLEEIIYIGQAYNNFAQQFPENSQKPYIIQDLAIYLKGQLNHLFNSYIYNNRQLITGLEYYTTYYTLQTKIADVCEAYEQQTRKWRRFFHGNYNYTGNKTPDIRDLIKKCPNRGQIWYRINDCPNTRCGTRPDANSFFDLLTSQPVSYQIERVGKKFKIVGKKKFKTQNKQKLQKQKGKFGKHKQVGCGTPMNFDLLPRLQNIELILKELSAVQTIDTVIHKLKQNKDVKDIYQQTKRKVQYKVEEILK